MKMHEVAFIGVQDAAVELFATSKVAYRILIDADPFIKRLISPSLKTWKDDVASEEEKMRLSILDTRKTPTVFERGQKADQDFWRG